jgi:hypothetical protein
MQAIQTKYLPATNTRGNRIKATCATWSITIDWPYGLDNDECFERAAKALMQKLDWHRLYQIAAGGQLPNGDYVFVLAKK